MIVARRFCGLWTFYTFSHSIHRYRCCSERPELMSFILWLQNTCSTNRMICVCCKIDSRLWYFQSCCWMHNCRKSVQLRLLLDCVWKAEWYFLLHFLSGLPSCVSRKTFFIFYFLFYIPPSATLQLLACSWGVCMWCWVHSQQAVWGAWPTLAPLAHLCPSVKKMSVFKQ